MPSDTDLTREAQKIWNALRPMVREEARKAALPAVRAKKMTVMTPPNGKTVGVAEPFGPTLDVPYSTAISHLVVGDSVWVQYFYDNASTMFVVCRGDGQTFGGEYPLTVAQGGTGAGAASDARENLGVPSVTGSGATGTWPISITGNAATVGGKNIDAYLPLAGGTLTGPLILSALNAGINIQRGNLRIGGDVNYRGIIIYGAAGAPSLIIRNTGSRLTLDEYANGSTGGERYLLPVPEARNADAWYGILTTKNVVTVAQGGTGCTDIGAITTVDGSTISVSNSTITNLGAITLGPGVYSIQVSCLFAANSAGNRQIGLAASATAQNMDRYTIVRSRAAEGANTLLSFTAFLSITAQTTYYANALQNSGGALNCYCGIRAMKIAGV